jgi:hypothetical protein
MGSITVLRPSATSSGVGWTPSTGTLHGVTSDDSDATYATWGGSGSPMILATPADSPPAGEKRHQVRLRARGEDGSAWWAVRLASGALAAGAAAQFASSPETIVGSWGFGAPFTGSTVLYTYVTGQSNGVRITELYLDVDSREAPTFTPQILDGSGSATTTVSDTAQPTIRASAVDTDDLAPRQYRYWVTLNGAVVWDTGVVSGAAVNRQTAALDNDTYTAHLQVWSTLGQDTAYASDEETLEFTVSVGEVPAPESPTVEPVEGTPFYRIEACAPLVEDLDGAVGYVEIQRVDCPVGGYLEMTGASGSYASTPAPDLADPVQIPDGDFESGVTGWFAVGGALSQSTDQAYDGTGSALVTVSGAPAQAYIRPDGPSNSTVVVPGRSYRVSGRVYSTEALADSGAAVDWYDGAVAYQSTDYSGGALAADTWTEFSGTFVAPIGAVYASHGLTAVSPSNGTLVYFDVLRLDDVTPEPDLDVTVVAGRDDDWRPAANDTLAAHYDTASNQRSWRLNISADTGVPFLMWSPDGTSSTVTATATERAPVDPFGVVRLRVVLDTDDGAGGWTATFLTRETDDDDWVQLGDVQSNSGGGTSTLSPSTAPYTVGAYLSSGSPLNRWNGRIYSVVVRGTMDGTPIVSPDFTRRLSGTTTFLDDQGNLWTVHSPASVYSPTSTVTVAMLGPLETDECAEWLDFTLPRTGVGTTCGHHPDLCCSYYRTRTVGRMDGDLRISDWSDAYNPGIPAGLIVMWPSTADSIPEGWDRATELDGRYIKGIADAETQPGATGGAATHEHTLPSHSHDLTHAHTVTGNTGAASGSQAARAGGDTVLAVAASHTHTRSDLDEEEVPSGSTSPGVDPAANDPAHAEVVFVESDGTPLGVPDGALAFSLDVALSGWDDFDLSTGRFIKGAAPGGDGGGTSDSAADSHTHGIDAHTHSGTGHIHGSPNTGSVAASTSLWAGPASALWEFSHTHPVSVSSSPTGSLESGGSGTSSASGSDLDPPFRNLRLQANISGAPSLPVGIICAWRGSLGSVPDGWQLCDGTNDTPDMFGRYPRAVTTDVGDTGGSLDAHDHTSPAHTHDSASGHSHTVTAANPNLESASVQNTSTTTTVATITHTHSGSSDSADPEPGESTSGTLASTTTEPPFTGVAFVQLMSEPEPPTEPDTFCLTWDDDQHLVRTTGPGGPLWAPVLGKFEWVRDRPFTAATGVNGTRFVTSAPPGGRNLSMTAAVENEAELAQLRAVLARPLVLISPSDASEVWAAPVAESVRIVKIGRIRQVTASFIGTGPEPPPQLADVGV